MNMKNRTTRKNIGANGGAANSTFKPVKVRYADF
jgi:hypothetical protein